ncbi:hypothetical protein NCS57_00368600 [Fusarium keratoplasticum]|uniref:Uncharacterized protein n=1 Tax=Fusarium keratoplasticum TaxID=1328300 RepID=A0ACC0R3A9_9HYPO|nr:hypothetical protein NCS57_00368600 [Fusarium keratoplasticum]KAI8674699.1 hypothetical protein NCS57_00368600 [Fusarium keratoplasticum]
MVILLAVPSKLAQLFPSIPTLIPKRTQEWQNKLCSCSPGHSCVLSLLFPDLLSKRTAARLRSSGTQSQDNEVKTRLGYETLSEGYQVNPVMEISQKGVSPAIEDSAESNEPSNTPMVGEN